jgi:hypothetical protein
MNGSCCLILFHFSLAAVLTKTPSFLGLRVVTTWHELLCCLRLLGVATRRTVSSDIKKIMFCDDKSFVAVNPLAYEDYDPLSFIYSFTNLFVYLTYIY